MRILNQIKRKNPVETSVQTLARKRRTPILFFILPLPGLIALLMFSYLPMVGLYIVFERYTYQGGLFGSEFVGLKNFEFFFRNMSNALRATRNTLVINCFSILFGIAVNVALAIAVNEIRSVRILFHGSLLAWSSMFFLAREAASSTGFWYSWEWILSNGIPTHGTGGQFWSLQMSGRVWGTDLLSTLRL